MKQKILITFVGNTDLEAIIEKTNDSSILKLIDSLKITNAIVFWDRKESPEEFIDAIAKIKISGNVIPIKVNPMDYQKIFEAVWDGLTNLNFENEIFYNMSSGTPAMKMAGFFLPDKIKLVETSREQGIKEIQIPTYIQKLKLICTSLGKWPVI